MRIRRSAVLRVLAVVAIAVTHLAAWIVVGALERLGVRFGTRPGVLAHHSPAARVRLFFQAVGGAYIKLAQILAMRVDFLPAPYVAELLKLLDEVPPFSPLEARRIVERELKGSIAQRFASFTDPPIAAASFGQVHAATLPGGIEVVVKVQRPGVPDLVAADLKLFRLVAALVDLTGLSGRTPLQPIVADFVEWTREELDYRIEGAHAQALLDRAAGRAEERFPAVHWSHTSARVLTLERLRGLWVKEIMQGLQRDPPAVHQELERRGTSLPAISQTLLRNTLRQIFVYGVFHADPHAANLLVTDDGGIGYVDLGITGRITDRSKKLQVAVHVALESGDADVFYTSVLSLLDAPLDADMVRFEREVKRLYGRWLTAQTMGAVDVRDKSFARLMLGITLAAQRSGAAMGSMEIRVFRALATVDAVLLQFAPALDVRAELRQFFVAYKVHRLVSADVPALIHRLPELVDDLSTRLEPTAVTHDVRERRAMRALSIASGLLAAVSLALVAAGAAVPRLLLEAADRSGRSPGALVATGVLAAGVLAWVSRLSRLRSVVRVLRVRGRADGPSTASDRYSAEP